MNGRTVVLGPCPCQGCRRWVTWNGWEWQGQHDWPHRCSGEPVDNPDRWWRNRVPVALPEAVSFPPESTTPGRHQPSVPLESGHMVPAGSKYLQPLPALRQGETPGDRRAERNRGTRAVPADTRYENGTLPGTGIAGSSPTQDASPDDSGHAEPITDQGAPGRGPTRAHPLYNADRPPKLPRSVDARSSGNGGRVPSLTLSAALGQ